MYFEVKQREAELRGEAIGQARGEAIGQARGEAIGQARGEYNKARNDAQNLLKEGLPVELISRAIDLPEDEVMALKGELEM